MIRNARDLSQDQRVALEALIGETLNDQDCISVRRIKTPAHLSSERRQELVSNLKRYFEGIDKQRKDVPEQGEDAILDQALRSTRPGYRPIR